MSKNKFEYIAPPPMPIALKNTVKRTVISATEQEAFIIKVVASAIKTGKIDVGGGVSDLSLDGMSASNASIDKGSFKEIGAIGEAVTISSEAILRSFVKIGTADTSFDTTGQYQLQVNEDVLQVGNIIDLRTLKFITKANVIQMGLDNTTSESFMQGLTFKKQDNYSSQGSIIINRVGLLSFPFGQFIDDKTYAPITNTKKRFEGARTSLRSVYLSSDLTFGDKLTSDDEFTFNQKSFIDDLNNNNNQASIYYTNFECNNINLHGGGLISGLGKDLEIILTTTSNSEEVFMTFDNASEIIKFEKGLQFTLTDFRFESSGSIGFTTNNFLNMLINSSQINFYRRLIIENDQAIQIKGTNIEFRDNLNNVILKLARKSTNTIDNRLEDITFNFFTGTFLTQGRFADVQLQLDDFTTISGPYYNSGSDTSATNNKNNPTLKIQNKENYAVDTNLPSTKTYVQSKYLEGNSNVTFTFANVCTTSQNDFIFSGFAIIGSTDTTDASHLHLRLDGSFNRLDTTTPNILTKTVIKRNILALESITFTETVDYTNSNGPLLDIQLTSTSSIRLNVSIKLEIIAI